MASHGKETQRSFFESLYASRDADAHEVADALYMGAASAAGDKRAMQKRGITHVLIAHPQLPAQHQAHFKYERVDLIDEPTYNLLEVLPAALTFLGTAREKGGRAFVYCAKGISRSASIVIALLMLERGLSFDEAFRELEKRRPIVYPNVGFQQQLRHLEKLLKENAIAAKARSGPWEQRVLHLRGVLPRGSLEERRSELRIRDAIGISAGEVLGTVDILVEKVFGQPQLLQQRELWKRHGLFFENMHKYKALPSDTSLLPRASAAALKLRSLPKVFSPALKGVKLALAVAEELDSWVKVVTPLLAKPEVGQSAGTARIAVGKKLEEGSAVGRGDGKQEDGKASRKHSRADMEPREGAESGQHAKRSKQERQLDKKAEKAARKMAKLEEAARQATLAAERERALAEEVAKKAEEAERAAAEEEAEEAFEAKFAIGRGTGHIRRGMPGSHGPRPGHATEGTVEEEEEDDDDDDDGRERVGASAGFLEARRRLLREAREELDERGRSPEDVHSDVDFG